MWKAGFAAAKMHFTSCRADGGDSGSAGCALKRETISYQIGFPDCEEAKRRILRFLMGADLKHLSTAQVNALFEPYRRGDQVLIATTYPHLVAEQAVTEKGISGTTVEKIVSILSQ
jgi:hypothetical protein